MDILTAIDSLSLSTPVPLTNAYLNTLFPTTGYAIVTPPPNSTSTYSTYTGGARGGLAKFVLAIHKDPVRASKMKTLRFDRQWDSYSHSGLLELLFGNLNVDGVVALVLQAELRGQEAKVWGYMPKLPASLETVRKNLVMGLVERGQVMDDEVYVMLIADCVRECCNSEGVILPDEWVDVFEGVFRMPIDSGREEEMEDVNMEEEMQKGCGNGYLEGYGCGCGEKDCVEGKGRWRV